MAAVMDKEFLLEGETILQEELDNADLDTSKALGKVFEMTRNQRIAMIHFAQSKHRDKLFSDDALEYILDTLGGESEDGGSEENGLWGEGTSLVTKATVYMCFKTIVDAQVSAIGIIFLS